MRELINPTDLDKLGCGWTPVWFALSENDNGEEDGNIDVDLVVDYRVNDGKVMFAKVECDSAAERTQVQETLTRMLAEFTASCQKRFKGLEGFDAQAESIPIAAEEAIDAWWRCGRCGLVQPDTYDQGCDGCAADLLVETDAPTNKAETLRKWKEAKAKMEEDTCS